MRNRHLAFVGYYFYRFTSAGVAPRRDVLDVARRFVADLKSLNDESR